MKEQPRVMCFEGSRLEELRLLLATRRAAMLEDVQAMRRAIPVRDYMTGREVGPTEAEALDRKVRIVAPADRQVAAQVVQALGDVADVVDEAPAVRLKFSGGGPGGGKRKVITDQIKGLKAFDEVVAENGRRYLGKATGQLTQKGGSDRAARRASGLSARQWKKQQKAARR